MTDTPRPSREHPAVWLRATELVVGDLVVTRSVFAEEREAGITGGPTAPITALTTNGKKGQARRWFVQVAGKERYPNGISDRHCVLVLR